MVRKDLKPTPQLAEPTMSDKESTKIDPTIHNLGKAKIPSPLQYCRFIPHDAKISMSLIDSGLDDENHATFAFETAGPRGDIYFDSTKVKCAIVTCGGLCPGINDVIRAIVMEARYNYNVAAVLGIRFGLEGFIPKYKHDIMELSPDNCADIHQFGGTVLGSSRGPQPPDEIVDALERMNVSVLFIVGGDGTMRAARKIREEIDARRSKISVIGIPKTIDNDISFVTRSFGFDSAVEKATEAILCAHTEAVGAYNGVGVVKVMGRESGFIAAQATLALKDVNFVLIPEYPFEMVGERGLLPALEQRLLKRKHAVIVLAEGAGQHLLRDHSQMTDASGNPVLGDISTFLIDEIKRYMKEKNLPLTLKFIDPSYIIRSIPANANDRVYCGFLGQHAVHAAMAGKTGMVVSKLLGRYVHLPLELVTMKRKKIDILSDYWRAVLESTGQYAISPMLSETVLCERK
jgi:6-phosphofructokinase 1